MEIWENGNSINGQSLILCYYDRAWKYDSLHIICANDHGSTDLKMHPAGKDILIQKGAILTDWVMEGKDGTYILPRKYVCQSENVLISSVVVEETNLNALPPAVYRIVSENPSKFKPPYLYGESPIFSWVEHEQKVEGLDQKITALNQQVNWYQ